MTIDKCDVCEHGGEKAQIGNSCLTHRVCTKIGGGRWCFMTPDTPCSDWKPTDAYVQECLEHFDPLVGTRLWARMKGMLEHTDED